MSTYLPVVGVPCQGFGHRCQFLGGIGAQAGDDAVHHDEERNHREQIGQQEPRPAKGADLWCMQQDEKGNREHGENGDEPAVGHLEDTDSLSGVDRVLKDLFCLGRGKMVERAEQCPEAGEPLREGAGIKRFFPEVDHPAGKVAGQAKGRHIRVAVSQHDTKRPPEGTADRSIKSWPRPAATGAKVYDLPGVNPLQEIAECRQKRRVLPPVVGRVLEEIGHGVADHPGTPGLVIDLSKLYSSEDKHSLFAVSTRTRKKSHGLG